MSFDAQTLYKLLPAIHRIRDEGEGGPLRALLAVLAEQLGVLEEDIEQLYDDQFIETCAPWVVPYIGDLVGYRPLHDIAFSGDGAATAGGGARAEVAHTIALRRRKGTAAVLEQLARDVGGWNAHAVEFFQRLGVTQYMNHVRPGRHQAPDLRDWRAIAQIGSAFESASRTVDVRRIGRGRGRHNIQNVGVFLWPVDAHRLTRVPATQVDDRRWRVSALGQDMRLYHRPLAEDSISHLAGPHNVPLPIARRALDAELQAPSPASAGEDGSDYGEGRSLAVYVNGALTPVAPADLCVCDLSDDGAGWAHLPDTKIAIDPVLGRIALPAAPVPPVTAIDVTFHHGFAAEIGGGEYERAPSDLGPAGSTVVRVPADQPDVQAALDALGASTVEGGDGVVVITGNGRYGGALSVRVRAGGRIELRSDDGTGRAWRPSLALPSVLVVEGGEDSAFSLQGVLVAGAALTVPASAGNRLARLDIGEATLVPGLALQPDGAPASGDAPCLVVEIADTRVTLTRSIVGAVRIAEGSTFSARDSVVDATAPTGVAFAAPDGSSAGGAFSLDGVTVIGKVHAREMPLVSNALLLARLAPADAWAVPVLAERRQTGCVRFSWLPPLSRVPRRHRCLPDADGFPAPRMLSLRYATPTYCLLSAATDVTIREGADDEGEPGAFHHLRARQRETNVRVRLEEYLRAGLESGVFFEI